ncbi:MAG: hypothetical protein ABJA78_01995 [Ferruginibacter sp.]
MKRIIITCLATLVFLNLLHGQSLDGIKTQVVLRQYKDAKLAIDKAITVDVLSKNPETWALRATVYSALADDSTMSHQEKSLKMEATAAFKKYKTLDPGFALMKDNVYISGPINLYTISFKAGAQDYNNKNWAEAYKNFATAVDYSDFLIQAKITTVKIDTSCIMYAGASAQNLKDDAAAFKYFNRLYEANVVGKDYEFLYQFIANYYMARKDDVNFEKAVAFGKKNYPDSKYFPAVAEDYANSKEGYFIKMKEGEELFAKLYPKSGEALPKGNIAAMEAAMIAAFEKAAVLKPEMTGLSYINIGNHFINKSVAVNDQVGVVLDAIKAFKKNAVPDAAGKTPSPSKELTDKRDRLFDEYDGYADKAIAAYEKAADFYSKKTDAVSAVEQEAYKNAVQYLIDLYGEKKTNAERLKSVDADRFAEKEKKWTDVYAGIK